MWGRAGAARSHLHVREWFDGHSTGSSLQRQHAPQGQLALTACQCSQRAAELLVSCLPAPACSCLQGHALARIPGLAAESAALIWTMVDRTDEDSPHAAFWAAMPPQLTTGEAACPRSSPLVRQHAPAAHHW